MILNLLQQRVCRVEQRTSSVPSGQNPTYNSIFLSFLFDNYHLIVIPTKEAVS